MTRCPETATAAIGDDHSEKHSTPSASTPRPNSDHASAASCEDEDPAEQRDDRRDADRATCGTAAACPARGAEQHHADDLPHELHEDPRHDQRVDHRAEREEAATIEIAPSTSSDTYGKSFVGCSRPNGSKK